MSKKHLLIRFILLVFVTVIFIGAFYFFFKNSQAGSPLNDKEYMQELSNASRRYNVAGEALVSPTPVQEKQGEGFFSTLFGPLTKFVKEWSY